jgi:ATP-dependent RNA helicase DHX57
LFSESNFKPGYLTYFTKTETSKVFLRDATEVPLFGLLLFGGVITINHWAGGIMLGKAGEVRLKAGTRIGVLCSQLRYVSPFPRDLLEFKKRCERWLMNRRLLDAQLAEMVENPGSGAVDMSGHEEVVGAMMALLQKDGLSVG